MKVFSRVLAISLFLLLSAALYGQSTSLSGTVTDPANALVPNAVLTLTNSQNGTTREAKSDGQGRYSFAQLTPGTYNLTAKAPGFSEVVVSNIELLVNQPATIPVALKLG